MSKSYLCKDCPHNNNGWCTKRKIQGLKSITECEFRDKDEPVAINVQTSSEKDKGFSIEAYKNMAKRELFHNIQRQIIAIELKDDIEDKFEAIKTVMTSLEKMLSVNESLNGLALEFMIDGDILKESKAISHRWEKQKDKIK